MTCPTKNQKRIFKYLKKKTKNLLIIIEQEKKTVLKHSWPGAGRLMVQRTTFVERWHEFHSAVMYTNS